MTPRRSAAGRWHRARWWLSAAGVALAGCVHTPFDRHLRDGNWVAAVDAVRSDSLTHAAPRVLREAAYLHALPDSPTWDPERAYALLLRARLSARGASATDLRFERLLRVHLDSTRALATRRDALEAEVGRLTAVAEELRAQHELLMSLSEASQEERALLQRLVVRLESDLRDREGQLGLLRAELDELKRIDLGVPARAVP